MIKVLNEYIRKHTSIRLIQITLGQYELHERTEDYYNITLYTDLIEAVTVYESKV